MLELVSIFAVYALLQKFLVDKLLIRRIKLATTTEAAIRCRAKLKSRRRMFFGVYLCLIVCFYTWLSILATRETGKFDVDDWRWVIMFPILGYVYLVSGKNLLRMMGNISTFTKDVFLGQTNEYALYLRGFETDDYTSEAKYIAREKDVLRRFKRKRNGRLRFSEYYFTRALQTRLPVCAVGMSKEVEAPAGAYRIYLEDATWKQDVRELMERAKEIYILVSDRPSCIWEIEQSLDMLHKTTFIVDDRGRYGKFRDLGLGVGGNFKMPIIPTPAYDYQTSDFVTIKIGKEEVECNSYENSVVGYSRLLGVPIPKSRKSRTGCGCLCTVLFSILILFILVYFSQESERKDEQKNREILNEYSEIQNYGTHLPVETVLGKIRILPPEDSVEVKTETQLYSRLDSMESDQFKCLKRYYNKHLPSESDLIVDGTLDILAVKVWNDTKFSAGMFRRQMEAERADIPVGKVIASDMRHNVEINGKVYDSYCVTNRVAAVSDITDEAFIYSVLAEEHLLADVQVQVYYTVQSTRFIRISEQVLILRARNVARDKDEATKLIVVQGKRLERWGAVIAACCNLGSKDIDSVNKDSTPNVTLDAKEDTATEGKQGVGMLMPLILIGIVWFVVRKLWGR